MVTRYVNTASSAGGDGTTNATSGANRAYASMSEAEASLSGTFSDTWEIIATGTAADTTAVVFDGFTTSSTNTLTIKANTGDEAGASWSTSKYRLSVNSAIALRINVANVRVQGLQIEMSSNASAGIVRCQNSNQIYSKCFIRSATNSAAVQGIATTNNACPAEFHNCIIQIRTSNTGARCVVESGTSAGSLLKFYNCDLIPDPANTYTVDLNATNTSKPTFRNCIIRKGATAIFNAGTVNASSNYNTTDHTSATGGANDRVSQTITFVADGTDFHLDASDTGAKDQGEDLTSLGFTDDIDGDTRSGTWDIGFDEVSGGATTHDAAITETLSPSDSQSAVATFVSAGSDSLSSADSQTGATTTASAASDSLTAADSSDAIISQDDSTTESLTVSDSSTALVVFAGAVSETLTSTDSQAGIATFETAGSESLTATDTQAGTADFTAATSESVSISESQSEGNQSQDAACSESGTISDSCDAEHIPQSILYREIRDALKHMEGSMDSLKTEIAGGLIELEGVL